MARRNKPRSYPQRVKAGYKTHSYRPEPVKVVRCVTGKQGFTHAVAEIKLADYAAQVNGRQAKPQRIYKCPDCGSWHLTSQPVRGAQ